MVKPAMLRDLTLAFTITAVFAGVLAAETAAAPAAAQTAPPRKELREACGADLHNLCGGILPGGGRIKQCMMEKFDQLSDGCKSAMKDARAQSTGK